MKYHGPKDRHLAAQSTDTPPEELTDLARSQHIFVREAVAANPNTPQSALAALLPVALQSQDDYRVALSLIRRPELDPGLAGAIAELVIQSTETINPRDHYPCRLVDALVRCKSAPAESLAPLTDPDSIPNHIRGRIAAPGARPELLAKLIEDPLERIRARAKRAIQTGE